MLPGCTGVPQLSIYYNRKNLISTQLFNDNNTATSGRPGGSNINQQTTICATSSARASKKIKKKKRKKEFSTSHSNLTLNT
jgi:hypothetical protein